MTVIVGATSNSKVNAQIDPIANLTQAPTLELQVPEKPKPKPEPKVHKVIKGDNLTKLSTQYSTTVERLFNKNTQLSNPDVLEVGEVLTIPEPSEALTERKPPVAPVVAENPSNAPQSGSTGLNGYNAYEPGQCVWALKEWRPELPNTWGSAYSWLASAQRDGWATGSTPRVGAVGTRGNHVVLITGINPDGSVNIKDMNGRWVPFEVGYGTHPASYYIYIY